MSHNSDIEHECHQEKELAVMTIKIANIEKNVDETKKNGQETKKKVEDLHDTMVEFIASADKKFVSKKELAMIVPFFGLAIVGFLVVNHLI